MLLWVLFATITAAALSLALAPLLRQEAPGARREPDDVYADQLREIARECAAGRLSAAEAESARVEVARRLLAADRKGLAPPRAVPPRRALAAGLAAAAALLAVGLYIGIGQPGLPDRPLAGRADERAAAAELAERRRVFEGLVAEVEKRLAEQPRDVQGWALLIDAYTRLERFADAAAAYGRILEMMPDGPQAAPLWSARGEALVMAADGLVTPAAASAFAAALERDPADGGARFYLALKLAQEGDVSEARQAFTALRDTLAADDPVRAAVERQLQALGPAG